MTGPVSRAGATGYRERNSTADRALDILQLFDDDKLVISGNEVSERLEVARSTAYRYLQSLTFSGFLEEAEHRSGYRLGPRLLELARLARKGIGLSEISRPIMRGLAQTTGETVLLTRRSGPWVVCLELEESDHPVRLSYERGHLLPANAGASALVLLAWELDEVVEKVLQASALEQFTSATITDSTDIMKRLEVIRQQGYASSRGELDADIVGVAAPIRDHSRDVVAAVGIAGLAQRINDDRMPALTANVVEASREISDRLALFTG
jgi:DNA-binding IclR family transcriptional regulator